jgi:hypothetical protein
LPQQAHIPDTYVREFREPALWTANALGTRRSRLRLTIVGIAYLRISIRIDEDVNGRLVGRAKVVDTHTRPGYGRHSNSGRLSRRPGVFSVSRARMAALQAAMDRAQLFRINPQYWVLVDPDMICVDGEEMFFERLDARGYHFANANAQCTAPTELRDVARMMLALAGERDLSYLVN